MDRRDRIGKDRRHVVAPLLVAPMRELDPAHQIAGLRKGRSPFPVNQHRVPADMVDMQMGAQHRVDRLAREPGRRQVGEKRPLEVVPGRDAAVLLVVAEAGIDDDAALGGLDDKRVDAHLQPAALVGEMRP